MATNPFLAARVPQALVDKIKERCQETGESKTELIIKILSAYFDLPVASQTPRMGEITQEMFYSLEERVKILEELLKTFQTKIVVNDNGCDNISNHLTGGTSRISVIDPDNKNDNLPNSFTNNENALEKTEEPRKKSIAISNQKLQQALESGDINTNDNGDNAVINTQNQDEMFDNTYDNVIDNKDSNLKDEYPAFKSITSDKIIEITGMTSRQINGLKGYATVQLKKEGNSIEQNQLLKNPILIESKKPITVNGNSYKLEYLGENHEGKAIWNLMPSKDENYQLGIIKLNYN